MHNQGAIAMQTLMERIYPSSIYLCTLPTFFFFGSGLEPFPACILLLADGVGKHHEESIAWFTQIYRQVFPCLQHTRRVFTMSEEALHQLETRRGN